MEAAEGIIKIVNENMCGALRLVSVEQVIVGPILEGLRIRKLQWACCKSQRVQNPQYWCVTSTE